MINKRGDDPVLSFQEKNGQYEVEIYYKNNFWTGDAKTIDVPKEVSPDRKIIKDRDSINEYYKAMVTFLIPRVARNGYIIMDAKDYAGPGGERQKVLNNILKVWDETKHLYVVNPVTKEVRLRDDIEVVNNKMRWIDIN